MIRIARNISTNISRNVSRSVGTEPDPVLDRYSGASAAYSLYDLGNRRGSVVETEATYHNPAVRLRRDSDNTHKTFPAGAFTQMQNWVNEDVETYASDFSAGVDGNTAKSGTVTGNVDSIGGEDDNLSFWADGTSTAHGINIPQGSFVTGNEYLVSVDVYIPSGNTNVNSAGIYFSSSSTVPDSTTTTDAWVTLSYQFTYGSGLDGGDVRVTQIVTGNNPNYVFTGANSASDDLIYIRNVSITQLTSNAFATTWYDQSGVQVESVSIDDDASVDNTTDWDITDGTLSFDTDHYVITWVANTQWVVDNTNSAPMVDGEWYRFRVDVKSGTGGDVAIGFGRVNATNTSQTTIDTSVGTSSSEWSTIELYWKADLTAGANNNLPTLFTQLTSGTLLFRNWKVEQLDKAHNDATQTTADNQPKVVDAGALVTDANGNVALDFDGTDDYLSANSLASGLTGEDIAFTRFISFESHDNATTQYLVGYGRSSTTVQVSTSLLHSSGNWGVQKRDDTNTLKQNLAAFAFSTTTVYLWSEMCSGTAIDLFADGVQKLTGFDVDLGASTLDRATIGGQIRTGAIESPVNGNISSIIIYPTDQSANRSAIEQSLSNTLTTALS